MTDREREWRDSAEYEMRLVVKLGFGTLAATLFVCALGGWLGGGCSGCHDDPLPVITHEPEPNGPADVDAGDADAGEDGGLTTEFRELITPQSVKPIDHRAYCDRPAYRNKRECKEHTGLEVKRVRPHGVGC